MSISYGNQGHVHSFSTLRQMDSHAYYNIVILPDNDKKNPKTKLASFIDSRGEAIIDLPNDYHVSILRFTVPTRNIPIFIYPTTGTEGDYKADNEYYSVTLKYANVSYQVYLTFTPENTGSLSNTEPYYYVYSYQNFINMINTALAAAYTKIPMASPTTQAPYLALDRETGLISLFAQQAYAGGNDGGSVSIFFNTPLASLLNSFYFKYRAYNEPFGEYAELIVEDTKTNTPVAPLNYYEMKQEYNNLADWAQLDSIIIATGSIPIKQENVPGALSSLGSTTDDTIPILADFIPERNESLVRQTLQYRPTAEYKRVDLQGTVPLTFFDIRLEWIDTKGVRHPLVLEPFGEPVTVKFLFEKKIGTVNAHIVKNI